MWYKTTTFYQIYPLGFCGCPKENGGEAPVNRICNVSSWIPHIQKLGAGAVLFNPVFESDAHGYDTRDFTKIDSRLGTNGDFAEVCKQLHSAGIRVVLDGVFNHVGRGFWAFQDLVKNRERSEYRDWFFVDFDRDSNYNDGFWYDGWEGHYELVKLNLHNEQVVKYLLDCAASWIDEYDIDGLRLDVAYCLEPEFVRMLRSMTDGKKQDFFLMGEMLHGDYKALVQPGMLHSSTNYECYKGIYSSFNSLNMFEIAYSLNRQFGAEDWTLYRGLPLFNFVDNHDVSRIATILKNKKHLQGVYGLLFGMPGIPSVYYGSEWGAEGKKENGDHDLRQCLGEPLENDLFNFISTLSKIHSATPALYEGGYHQVYLTNHQFVFERKTENQRVLIAINAGEETHTAALSGIKAASAKELISGKAVKLDESLEMDAYSVQYILL